MTSISDNRKLHTVEPYHFTPDIVSACVQDEHGSASDILSNLRKDVSFVRLVDIGLHDYIESEKQKKRDADSLPKRGMNFKKWWPNVVGVDNKTLARQMNGNFRLRDIRTVPALGAFGNKLLNQFVAENVPIMRASWFVKTVYLNLREFMPPKAGLLENIDSKDKERTVKWTSVLLKYMEGANEQKRNYCVRLICWQYYEGIVDHSMVHEWLLKGSNSALELESMLSSTLCYLDEFKEEEKIVVKKDSNREILDALNKLKGKELTIHLNGMIRDENLSVMIMKLQSVLFVVLEWSVVYRTECSTILKGLDERFGKYQTFIERWIEDHLNMGPVTEEMVEMLCDLATNQLFFVSEFLNMVVAKGYLSSDSYRILLESLSPDDKTILNTLYRDPKERRSKKGSRPIIGHVEQRKELYFVEKKEEQEKISSEPVTHANVRLLPITSLQYFRDEFVNSSVPVVSSPWLALEDRLSLDLVPCTAATVPPSKRRKKT